MIKITQFNPISVEVPKGVYSGVIQIQLPEMITVVKDFGKVFDLLEGYKLQSPWKPILTVTLADEMTDIELVRFLYDSEEYFEKAADIIKDHLGDISDKT